MKKILMTTAITCMLTGFAFAQDAPATEVDKKWRFGLRVAAQPSWLASDDKNNIPDGAVFGLGFGLNVERKFSNVACLLTGIGGDFEGGKYTFKNDPVENYVVRYSRDADQFVAPSDTSSTKKNYTLAGRKINTTHVTIPFILKLSTKDINGSKYFGMFGAELGIRVKSSATDTYSEVTDNAGVKLNITEENDINLRDEGTVVPMRIGLNAGLGMEYNLVGSTSFFASVNFFYSFTSLMRKESDYAYFRLVGSDYSYIKQALNQNAIRINVGIMF